MAASRGAFAPPLEALPPLAHPPIRWKKWSKSAIFGKFLNFCPLRIAFCPLDAPHKNFWCHHWAPDLYLSRAISGEVWEILQLHYCICWVTVLSMSKRLKSAIAVFVFKQLDLIFLYVLTIHAWRMICKDYVMICLSILYKTSLVRVLQWSWSVAGSNPMSTHFLCSFV